MKAFKSNLSKSARRKLRRYGKIPVSKEPSESAEFMRKKMIDLGILVQSGTQEHLWHRGKEMANLYKLKELRC